MQQISHHQSVVFFLWGFFFEISEFLIIDLEQVMHKVLMFI